MKSCLTNSVRFPLNLFVLNVFLCRVVVLDILLIFIETGSCIVIFYTGTKKTDMPERLRIHNPKSNYHNIILITFLNTRVQFYGKILLCYLFYSNFNFGCTLKVCYTKWGTYTSSHIYNTPSHTARHCTGKVNLCFFFYFCFSP